MAFIPNCLFVAMLASAYFMDMGQLAIESYFHHQEGRDQIPDQGTGGLLQRNHQIDPGFLSPTKQDNFTFNVYWGLACNCSEIGIDLDLKKWGILANKNFKETNGEVFNAFHKNDFGYPYIDDDTGKFVNDGLPQARTLKVHLETATEDIIRKIPNPMFNGLVVIDWEKWHPLLDRNKGVRGVYKTESIKLVRVRLHNYDNETIMAVARVEFEEAARGLMQGLLHLGKTLRPNATWGFYHYPYCQNVWTEDYSCLAGINASNNKMTWLIDESSALYPSIYLHPTIKDNYHFVDARLREALRVLNNVEEPGKPVYVYNRFNYTNSGLYYNIGDVKMSVRKAASLSFDGIVLWGDLKSLNNKPSCTQLKSLLTSIYGPALLNTKMQAESCSRKMCSGYGRCLLDDSVLRNTTGDAFWEWQSLEFIKCRCLTGWMGNDCSKKSNI